MIIITRRIGKQGMTKTQRRISYIYRVRHPVTGDVKYIGATVDLTRRAMQIRNGLHVGKRLQFWAYKLKEKGLRPKLEMIEECTTRHRRRREKYWIEYYVNEGADLLNCDGVRRKYSLDKPG